MVPSKYFGAFAPGYHNSRSAPAAWTTDRAARAGADARDWMRAGVVIGRANAACLAASIIVCACAWSRGEERALNALACGGVRSRSRARVAWLVVCTKVTLGCARMPVVEDPLGRGDSVPVRDWSMGWNMTPLMYHFGGSGPF